MHLTQAKRPSLPVRNLLKLAEGGWTMRCGWQVELRKLFKVGHQVSLLHSLFALAGFMVFWKNVIVNTGAERIRNV